jgi:tetratricopeptide (TPR) repeat protein
MEGSRRVNEYERVLMLQAFGHIYASQEKYAEAVKYFEQCLGTSALPPAAELSIRYNLGQLYLAIEQYDDAIRTLEAWLKVVENPAPEAYMALANAYAQKQDYASALPYAKTAVAKSKEPREGWLKLLLALYFEQKQYKEAASVLETLVARFPRRTYWIQLAALYGSLERERDSLAAYEMAYKQGFLTKSKELIRLAELYLYHEVPYKAAILLQKELESGQIESNRKAWELLANSWLHAQETEHAIPALKRAAGLSDNGNLYLRLAQLMVDRERWDDADRALASALEKGKLKRPGSAHLLRGITRFNRGQKNLAQRSFEIARNHERTRKPAEQWLRHVRNVSESE